MVGKKARMAKVAGSAANGLRSAASKHKRRDKASNAKYHRVAAAPSHLIAKQAIPKSKHKTYYELADNSDKKKKKLEFEKTANPTPSANFTFVPVGTPELTIACKELSREEEALIYIVSGKKEALDSIGEHVHRIGYHFRTNIVERAAASIGAVQYMDSQGNPYYSLTSPDVIPDRQDDINKQADAALRDLYPRIPNPDREMIIRHAFQKGATFMGKPVVGLQQELTLSRRVQLAVLAHIRHTHTRYDQLLRETTWENARRTVESLCLDIIIKWRGDEETGRDQLDEILREVVVISDSEEDGSDDDDDEGDDEDSSDDEEGEASSDKDLAPEPTVPTLPISSLPAAPRRRPLALLNANTTESEREGGIASRLRSKKRISRTSRRDRRFRKGLKRYDRRYEAAWKDALSRRPGKPHRDLDAPADGSVPALMPGQQLASSAPTRGTSGFQRPLRVYNEDPLDDSVPAVVQNRQPVLVGRQSHQIVNNSANTIPLKQRHTVSPRKRTAGPIRKSDESRQTDSPARGSPYQPRQATDRLELPTSNSNYNLPRTGSRFSRPVADVPQDMPLPSIEAQYEPLNGSRRSPMPYYDARDDYRQPEVRRQNDGPPFDRAGLPQSRSEIVYLDSQEQLPKRRRLFNEDERAPYIDMRAEKFSHGEPLPMHEHHPMPTKDESERRFIVPRTLDYPGYVADPRSQVRVMPQRIVRVVRRVAQQDPPPLGALSIEDRQYNVPPACPSTRELQEYERSRVNERTHFFNASERAMSQMQTSPENFRRPIGTSQADVPLVHHQPPPMDSRERIASERIPSLSSLSAHAPSRYQEMSGGPISAFQTFSRPPPALRHHDDQNSQHAAAQYSSSHPLQRLPEDDRGGNAIYRQDEVAGSFEPHRGQMQPQYIKMPSDHRPPVFTEMPPAPKVYGQPVYAKGVRRRDGIVVLD